MEGRPLRRFVPWISIAALALPAHALTPPPISNPLAPTPDRVTLTIDASAYTSAALAETKTCAVSVPDGSVAGQVLDAATASGCIAGWTWSYDPSFLNGGRLVTGVDGRESPSSLVLWNDWPVETNYWVYNLNGVPANFGVDAQPVHDGDTVAFYYCDAYCYGPALP